MDTEIKQTKEQAEKTIVEKETIITQVTKEKEEKTKELELKQVEFTQTLENTEVSLFSYSIHFSETKSNYFHRI